MFFCFNKKDFVWFFFFTWRRPKNDDIFMTDIEATANMNESNGIIPPENLSLSEDNQHTLVI